MAFWFNDSNGDTEPAHGGTYSVEVPIISAVGSAPYDDPNDVDTYLTVASKLYRLIRSFTSRGERLFHCSIDSDDVTVVDAFNGTRSAVVLSGGLTGNISNVRNVAGNYDSAKIVKTIGGTSSVYTVSTASTALTAYVARDLFGGVALKPFNTTPSNNDETAILCDERLIIEKTNGGAGSATGESDLLVEIEYIAF